MYLAICTTSPSPNKELNWLSLMQSRCNLSFCKGFRPSGVEFGNFGPLVLNLVTSAKSRFDVWIGTIRRRLLQGCVSHDEMFRRVWISKQIQNNESQSGLGSENSSDKDDLGVWILLASGSWPRDSEFAWLINWLETTPTFFKDKMAAEFWGILYFEFPKFSDRFWSNFGPEKVRPLKHSWI